jgi:hypothetical protein
LFIVDACVKNELVLVKGVKEISENELVLVKGVIEISVLIFKILFQHSNKNNDSKTS